MYYPGRIERRHGVRFPIAIAMEDQTLPYGLGALWAGSGARYSWKGICGCATRMRTNERRPHEIYWWEGADGSRVLMKWHTLLGKNESMGGYAEARDPAAAVEFVDADPGFRSLYPYPVIGVFGKGWDDLKTLTDEFVTVAREKTNASRKVIVSNQLDFFQDFESAHGDELPTMSVGLRQRVGSLLRVAGEVSARVRRAVERLRAAEGLATLVSLERPAFWSSREAAREQAWLNLGVYWEHNWTADGPVTRGGAGRLAAPPGRQIGGYVDALHDDAAYALGDLIRAGGRTPPLLRLQPPELAPHGRCRPAVREDEPAHVVDVSHGPGGPVAGRPATEPGVPRGARASSAFSSPMSPPWGTRCFEMRPGPGRRSPPPAPVRGGVIESDLYRIELEGRGAIGSWIDKATVGGS